MKNLYILFLLGCPPADLETTEDSEQFAIIEPPAPPNGVITADDCRHVDRGDMACNFVLHDQNSERTNRTFAVCSFMMLEGGKPRSNSNQCSD